MRHILSAAAAVMLFLGASSAQAANEPLVLGLGVHPQSANVMLSALNAASLARDPSGNGLLQPEECRLHGACATPLIYCHEIRRRHSDSELSEDDTQCLSQIARYIGGLKCRPASGEAILDRLTSEGVVASTDHARQIHKGEYACQDTAIGEDIFLTDCGNVRESPKHARLIIIPECEEIHLFVRAGDTGIHFALGGYYKPSACFALRGPGDPDFGPLPTHCPEENCDYSSAEADWKLRVTQSGGFPVVPGEYVVRVSAEFARNPENVAGFCLSQGERQSCRKDITPADYTGGIAVIDHDPRVETPQGWHGVARIWRFPFPLSCHEQH